MIEEKLEELGISLPTPPNPAGSYVPIIISDKYAFVSGQIPMQDGKVLFTGKVSDENINVAQKSAKLCAINILAQLKKELGSLEKIKRIVRMSGFVNCDAEFTKHPLVINAASDLMFDLFGEKGKHSRIAVGVTSLPLNSMTEIDAVIQIE